MYSRNRLGGGVRMSEDDIVRKIMQVIYDFNDTDEFCQCPRLSSQREAKMIEYLDRVYALIPVYTGNGYIFLRKEDEE